MAFIQKNRSSFATILLSITQGLKTMHNLRRLMLLAVLALASVFQLVGCGQKLTPAEYVAKAQEHWDKGEWRPAFIELSNALQQDPNTLAARWLMAKVVLKLGDPTRAEKEVKRAMELGLSPAEAQPVLVKSIILQGDLDRVLAETERLAYDMTPADQALLLGLRGQAYVLKGQLEHARVVLEQALKLEPKAPEALVGMAVLQASQQEYDAARQSVALALEANPTSPEAWSILGELEWTQGKAAEAEAAFGKAIQYRRYPTIERAKRALARIQLGKFADAEADIQELKKQQGWKDHPYVNYVAGLIRFRQKQYAEAAEAFEASYNADAAFLPNQMYLAITRFLLGQTQQARGHAQAVYAKAPQSPVVGRLLGAVNISLAEYAAAKEALQATLRNQPEDQASLRMLTTVSLLEGDAAKGVEYSQRLAALDPKSEQAQEMLMVAKLMAGQPIEEKGASKPAAEGDDYSREFLRALEAFRNNQVGAALERAKKLHTLHPDRIDPLNLMAACYLAAGQWDLARVELEKVLALKANEPSATRNLAKVEAQQGHLEKARTLLQPLVKEQPGDEETALLLAEIETRLGNPEAGLAVLQQALEKNPNALIVRAKLAQEHFRAGRWPEVLTLTRELTNAQFQEQPVLLEFQGKSQMQMGELAAGKDSFRRWAEAMPNSAEAHFLYGDTLARSGEGEKAGKELLRTLEIDRTYLPARVGEIKLLVHQNKLEQAKTALGQLRKDFGERPEVLGIEGWFALGTGDYPTAAKSLSAVLAQKPDTEVTILLVRALWAQQKQDEAIQVMKDVLQAQPKDLVVLMHLAGAYLGLNRNAEARDAYAKVVEYYPNHVPALNNLAWLTQDQDLKQAIAYAERARQLLPQDPYVQDTLGTLMVKSGDAFRGALLIRSAAEQLPDDPQIQLHFGRVLVQQQKHDEARKVLSRLVEKAPDSEQAKEAKPLLESLPPAE
jgi:putative PEP-CTERM system TPR-repeat lipoprotein